MEEECMGWEVDESWGGEGRGVEEGGETEFGI